MRHESASFQQKGGWIDWEGERQLAKILVRGQCLHLVGKSTTAELRSEKFATASLLENHDRHRSSSATGFE